MDRLQTLDYALDELQRVVGAIDDSAMDGPTNCEPWTVRRLASHALNNQLVWAGVVTGQHLVALEDAMGAVPIDGDLHQAADEITARARDLWRTDGILDAVHATPFGELPGSAVIDFAIIDAAAHAWDLSSSVGRPIEFDPAQVPSLVEVGAATCTDAAREIGLIKSPAPVSDNATATERLMASAGRSVT